MFFSIVAVGTVVVSGVLVLLFFLYLLLLLLLLFLIDLLMFFNKFLLFLFGRYFVALEIHFAALASLFSDLRHYLEFASLNY